MFCETIKLWKDGEFQKKNELEPTLTTYVLDGEKNRKAVLICPGGGYEFVSPREGEPIALAFNAAGYHAFVLNYSVKPYAHPQPLLDVSRAMCIIRDNAEAWRVNPEKIAVCGSSAGGHLAASLGIYHNDTEILNTLSVPEGKNKPTGRILCYSVISSGEFAHRGSFTALTGDAPALLDKMSLEKHVTPQTPPTFLWHTVTDDAVPVENSMMFASALRKNGVPFELHLYPTGGHGLSLAVEETADFDGQIIPHVATWIDLACKWMEEL